MPYLTDGLVTDNLHATRAVQMFLVRQDTLAAQSLPQFYSQDNVAALYTFLKTQTTVTFPTTAQIEGVWREPGVDGVFMQVWDSSFSTIAQNDQIPLNVV
jgi:hypothetical protein